MRRIEALTGRGAQLFIQQRLKRLQNAAAYLKAAPDELDPAALDDPVVPPDELDPALLDAQQLLREAGDDVMAADVRGEIRAAGREAARGDG